MSVDVDRRGAVAIITINQPDKRNAMNSERLRALHGALRQLDMDRSVRCIVLTGAGDRAFVAGADISEMATLAPDEGLAFARLGHAVTAKIEQVAQPVIAAVNGFALGGGCELALACDIRLASETAVFAQPEVGLGVPPGWGGTQRLARVVGPGLASEMIFTGRRVDAGEALRVGLVNAVYAGAELMEHAVTMAERIAANSPRAVSASKQLIGLALAGNPSNGLATEARRFADAFGSADQREGMAAFLEKRTATFQDEQAPEREGNSDQ